VYINILENHTFILYIMYFLICIVFYILFFKNKKSSKNEIIEERIDLIDSSEACVYDFVFLNKIISNHVKKHWINSTEYYSFNSINKFLKYFFPEDIIIQSNMKIYGIQDTNMTENTLNIIICVENCNKHPYYNHYNKYGNYGNDKIQIYFYNHIDKCKVTSNFIAIPVIYTQINYFKMFYPEIKPSVKISFKQKKFCLFAYNKQFSNRNRNTAIKILKNMGDCDDLDIYKHLIKNKSCYHSIEFLNILQQYKFIFVCENSIGDGYITEKIFNCFYARSIPIYIGCKNVENYFNKSSFINANDLNNLNKIISIQYNETLYNNFIHEHKISTEYDDEDYKTKLKTFIDVYLENNLCKEIT
jgi:hypothetical protein